MTKWHNIRQSRTMQIASGCVKLQCNAMMYDHCRGPYNSAGQPESIQMTRMVTQAQSTIYTVLLYTGQGSYKRK